MEAIDGTVLHNIHACPMVLNQPQYQTCQEKAGEAV